MSDPDNSGSDRVAADILVLGGIVVTMDERRTILTDGAWRFAAIRFLRSAPARRSRRLPCCEYRRRHGCLVIPGLIDATLTSR